MCEIFNDLQKFCHLFLVVFNFTSVKQNISWIHERHYLHHSFSLNFKCTNFMVNRWDVVVYMSNDSQYINSDVLNFLSRFVKEANNCLELNLMSKMKNLFPNYCRRLSMSRIIHVTSVLHFLYIFSQKL